jgi:hypothetical protein
MRNWSPDYDRLKLGGEVMPGIAHVKVHLTTGLDLQKPRGAKKCRTRDSGDKPAKVSIRLELNPDEYDALRPHVALLRPRGKNAPRDPVAIVHPKCAFWDINSVTIGDITDPDPPAGGNVVIEIDAFEWTPEASKVNKPAEKPKDEAEGWGVPLKSLPPSQSPRGFSG